MYGNACRECGAETDTPQRFYCSQACRSVQATKRLVAATRRRYPIALAEPLLRLGFLLKGRHVPRRQWPEEVAEAYRVYDNAQARARRRRSGYPARLWDRPQRMIQMAQEDSQ